MQISWMTVTRVHNLLLKVNQRYKIPFKCNVENDWFQVKTYSQNIKIFINKKKTITIKLRTTTTTNKNTQLLHEPRTTTITTITTTALNNTTNNTTSRQKTFNTGLCSSWVFLFGVVFLSFIVIGVFFVDKDVVVLPLSNVLAVGFYLKSIVLYMVFKKGFCSFILRQWIQH